MPARPVGTWSDLGAAAIIPFGNNLRQDLVNPRVGNTLVHSMTGPLIAQMWVQ